MAYRRLGFNDGSIALLANDHPWGDADYKLGPVLQMSLHKLLLARIAQNGPLSVADYMAECLLHPEFGYYTTRDPFGAAGDFITAPEISQMFGELLGLCIAQAWIDQGRPNRFTLAEVGPGRGTLMADMLRATKNIEGFHRAADIVLIEASAKLIAQQKKTLSAVQPRWISQLDDLPDQPLFLVANEFYDALPIRQFMRQGAAWRERQVGSEGGNLSWGLGPALPQPFLNPRLADTDDGTMVEYAPAAGPITVQISARINAHGGAALILDYGDWQPKGDSFQAVKAHEKIGPLETPGAADLTAHVDFAALARAAAPAAHSALTPQGVFLERLGITARAEALAQNLTGGALQNHITAHRRLTHPEEMGSLFKVMALMPQGTHAPAGLDDDA